MSSASRKQYSGLARGRVLVMRSFLLLLLISVEPSTNALTCSQFCELLESGQYSGIFPAECACSFNNRLRAGSLDKETNIGAAPTIRDAAIYYEPVESNVPYYISFVEQPFYIINPAIKKIYKNNAEYKKSLFNENIRSTIDEIHQTVTKGPSKQNRKGNYIHEIGIQSEELPLYLDIGIHKPNSNERSVSKELLGIENNEDLEQNLKECVDLHILVHIRNISNADLKEIWDENKIKRYKHLSDIDLKTKIKNKCKLPANVVQESLEQIKKSWPSKNNRSNTHTQYISMPASNVYKQNKTMTLRQGNLAIKNGIDNVSLGSEFSESSTEYVDTFTSDNFNIEDYTADHNRKYSEYEQSSLDTTTKFNLVNKYFTLKATTDHNEIISSTILPLELNRLNSTKNNQIPKLADNVIDSLIQKTQPNEINKNPGFEYDENENFEEIANLISSLKNTSNLLMHEENNNDVNINNKYNVDNSKNARKQQVNQKNYTIVLLPDTNLVNAKTYDEMSTNSDPIQYYESTTPHFFYVQGHNHGVVNAIDNLEMNLPSDRSIDKIPPTVIYRNSYGLSTTESNKRKQHNQSNEISDQDPQSSNPASMVLKFSDATKHNNKSHVNTTTDLPVEGIWTDRIYQDIVVVNITDRPFLTTNNYISPGNSNYYFESNEAVPSVEKPPTIFKDTLLSNQNKLGGIDKNKRVQYLEKDLKIPKIITKELVKDKAVSEINGIELLPNNDFVEDDEKEKPVQDITNIPGNILNVETRNGLRNMNNSDVVGNLYFLFNNHSIPAHFVQNISGEIKLGIDGNTFCDRYKEKDTSDSIILTTICNCLRFNKCK